MKQFILMALAAVLLVALGFQTGRIVERRNATPAAAEEHISPAAAINEEEETSMECNGTLLTAENAKILNYKGEEVALGSLAGDSTVIARFSSTACRPCLDALASSVKTFATEHPGKHVAMIVRNMGLRDLFVFSKDFGPNVSFYACDTLPVDFDNGDTPALFQLKENGRVYNHFTCRYGDYGRTDRYLASLK